MMRNYILKLKKRENLTRQEIEEVMRTIMAGQAAEEDIAEFLLDLRAKGPSIEELTGAARIMRQYVVGIKTRHQDILDTCGTGGDKKNTFNISTASALVAAGAGAVVAKHGNRRVSGPCGSADVLEALGVNLDMEEALLGACLDEVGITFLFAQKLHPAMKNVAAVRKKLGVETIFNILGPLTNPAMATHQMIGVYSRDLTEPLAHVLKNLGLKKALVVHGSDGLDEVTITGRTFISEYNGREVISYDMGPEELGFQIGSLKDLEGGDLSAHVRILKGVLSGAPGPQRDIVVLNAAYALYAAEKTQNIEDAVQLAQASIDSGNALKKLEALKAFTHR
ncbi:MAG TPA: anthranilate phosphoribosyltransferase [Candidatus Omnitrophica bacterium]|nr:MAG: anthranilate phosphoribosyltransferase [Omnitrophica WOR_2 bacterium GWA2_45_18]HBR15228.1 anthranilate phosphoribosyltransferase [Candidatus Omnitrophota bacterium]